MFLFIYPGYAHCWVHTQEHEYSVSHVVGRCPAQLPRPTRRRLVTLPVPGVLGWAGCGILVKFCDLTYRKSLVYNIIIDDKAKFAVEFVVGTNVVLLYKSIML